MSSPLKRRILIAAGIVAALVLTVVVAGGGWINRKSPAPAVAEKAWVGTWAAALTPAGKGLSGTGFTDQTVRMVIRTSVGGEAVRIRLSNNYGTAPLVVGRTTVALPVANDSPQIDSKTLRELTFNGQQSVTIPRGGQVFSDPLTMDVPALQELAISLFLPVATGPTTFHLTAQETSFLGAGDQATKADFTVTDTRPFWFFLSGVDVQNPKANGSIVILGDSIADGVGSTLGLHRRWPDYLAARLISDTTYGDLDPGVLNQGLAGNAVNKDGSDANFPELGDNGISRLHRDVGAQAGVHTVILALGINDIQLYDDPASVIIDGIRQLAIQSKELGFRVIGCTLMPFEGFSSWTPAKEKTRAAVNAYIRDSQVFDAVFDFDVMARDSKQPTRLRADIDSGDHIHLNDAGAEQLANAIPLELLYPEHSPAA